MSYRTIKRALGETNLERKCRWLFGGCLLLFISGSFWFYGKKTDEIVIEQNRFTGEALANAALMEAHFTKQEKDPNIQETDIEIADLLRKRNYDWVVLHPKNEQGIREPTDQLEWDLMVQWIEAGRELKSDKEINNLRTKWDLRLIPKHIDSSEQGVNPSDDNVEISEFSYLYYEAVYAKQKCITCHSKPIMPVFWPDMHVGDLLAIVRVEFDADETKKAQDRSHAFLLVAAITAVSLSMIALYVIVRYIIVKPLRHLREVSDAVRRGDVEKRATIHTGDEFEELGAAFNRMLRQLLRQQDELRDVNGELDGKLDELAQTNLRLFEMNQLKSDFLATISHELRTPLNSIIGFSDLLGTVDALDEKHQRFANNIQRSGKQLLEMINDILDLAKIESGKMELRLSQFNIGTVVATQCDLARPLSERKNIDLECEIAPGLSPVAQDQGKLEQVINNLLSNAIKFTPDGGRIDVRVWRDGQDQLRLVVADTGVGISESEQLLVFEKFRQGTTVLPSGNAMTREYSGTGLGLSIVRELCRLLGGDISLESELGKGSQFTVHMPWTLAEQPRMDSTMEDELRQMTKPRTEMPMLAQSGKPKSESR